MCSMGSINLLGVKRLIHLLNPEKIVPQTSVILVNVDREKIEQVRKNKGIYIRTFEEKINLSKSRYYRWLNYEIDLPMEYLVSITKLLGFSSLEFKDLFVNSMDELLQMILLLMDVSFRKDEGERRIFENICKELEKFRFSKEDTQLYQLMLIFCDMVKAIQNSKESNYHIQRIEEYLTNNEYFTLYDIILYIGLLRFKQYYGIKDSYVESSLESFTKIFLSKISADRLIEGRTFLLGTVVDISILLFKQYDYQSAYHFLLKAKEKINTKWTLMNYDRHLLDFTITIVEAYLDNENENIKFLFHNLTEDELLKQEFQEQAFIMTNFVGSK